MVDDIEDQDETGQIGATLETVLEPSVIELPAVVFRDPDRGEPTESATRVKAGTKSPVRKPVKATKPAPKKTNYQPFHW